MDERVKVFLPTSLDEVFGHVVDFAQHLFAFPAAAYVNITEKKRKIIVRLREPVGHTFMSAFVSRVQDSIGDLSDISWRKGAPEIDLRGSIVNKEDTRDLRSYFACPIAVDEKTSAVLSFGSNNPAAFSASSIQLVTALTDHYSRFLSTVNAAVTEVRHKAEIQIVEEKLRSEKELVGKLRKLDELKSGFISLVSHELRTPMTAVKSSIQLILDGTAGPVTEDQCKWLEMAMRNIDRLSSLINDVLDMSRIERGHLKLEFSSHVLRPVAEHVLASIRHKAAEKNCSAELGDFDSTVECYFDTDAITQVLMNLVGNAISHNPAGTRIVVAIEEVSNILATVSVVDDGKGIPQEEVVHIFDKFYQVEKSLNKGSEGSGLGLAISKGIIEAHGGRIWCESTPRKGTKFKFSIPRTPEARGKIVRHPRPPRESEILFGKIAVLLGYAEESQVEECVRVQSDSEDNRILGEIMVEKGILSNDQREEVLKIQRANLKKPHGYDPVRMLADIIFGRLAVKFNYLNQKQVNECVRIQASKHTAGQDCRLGELAVEKGYCSISDVLDILSLQGVTVMACSECDNQTNVFYYSPIKDYRCVVCGGKLVPVKEYSSED